MNELEGIETGYWTPEDREEFLSEWWEEEPLTPEEQAASDRAQARLAHEEAIGELYASQFAFD